MVCDLQGIELDEEFLLTDPAILEIWKNEFWRKGYQVANHRCNDIYKKLKLKIINDEPTLNNVTT